MLATSPSLASPSLPPRRAWPRRACHLAERDLADSLRVLNLTPGARKSVRTGAREVDQATKAADPLQAKILKLMP